MIANNAYETYKRVDHARTVDTWTRRFVVGVILFIVLMIFTCVRCAAQELTRATIRDTINKVHDNLRDVNIDNQVDCIDYAVCFYDYWPGDVSTVKIMRNINRATGMNHLYNKVTLSDGTAVDVEPQAYKVDYDPRSFWGNKFQPAVSYNETTLWAFWSIRKKK